MATQSDKFEFIEVDCPVCGANDFRFLGYRGGEAHHLGSGEKTSIVRCNKCSHQYPNPMPFPFEGNLDEIYINADVYFRGHDVEAKKNEGLKLFKTFETKLGRKGTFLDVGCAAGEYLWAAKQSGWEYEGVDPSSEFIRLGEELHDVEGRICLLEDANFPDEHFDAISMSSVIEHVYSPVDLLREIRRVLKPDGVFWFDAPNEDGLYMSAGNLYMKLRGKDWVVTMAPTFPPYHVQGFNPASLKQIMSRSGFSLDSLNVWGSVWEFTGEPSLRKKIEFKGAQFLAWLGNRLNRGSYMSAWATKSKDFIGE